jgi:lipopolysaccharide export system permease protein
MKLLQRHILWNVLTACAVAVGLFAGVLLLGNAMKDMVGLLLAGQLTTWMGLHLLALLVPYVAAYALPMGVLTGVLLVLGRMSAQQEITAMRAAGLGVGWVARPILLLGVLGTLLTGVVNFEHMPQARTQYRALLADAVRQNPLSFLVPRTFIRNFPGVVIYAGERSDEALHDLWLWQVDRQDRVVAFGRAEVGRIVFDETTQRLLVTLERVAMEYRDPEAPEDFAPPPRTGAIESWPLEVELDALFGRAEARRKLDWLTLRELWAEHESRRAAGDEAGRMQVAVTLHRKAATAVAVLAFAFLAVPLGIKVSRRETSANLGVALLLVMGYYFLTIVVGWLDRYPAWRPDLWAWLPTLLFLGLGGWLYRRVGQA